MPDLMSSTSNRRQSTGPSISSASRLRLLGIVIFVAALALIGAHWWRLSLSQEKLRAATVAQATARVTQLADLQAHHIEALLLGIDLSLRQYRDAILLGNQALADSVASNAKKAFPAGAVVNFALFGEQGRADYADRHVTVPVDVRKRDYFIFHQASEEDRLFITKPLHGQVSGSWVVLLTRPILKRGRFAGVAAVSLSVGYLATILAQLQLGPTDAATLLFNDGAYVARSQAFQELLGKSVPLDRPFLGAHVAVSGSYSAISNSDALLRLFAWHKLGGYPFVVVVGLDEYATLAPVEQEIELTRERNLIGTALLLALVTIVSILLEWAADKQKALEESEFFFKESQRAASIGSYNMNLLAAVWESSEVLDQIFGIDKRYARTVQGWLDIVHADDREMMDRYLREEVLAKRGSFDKEYRVVRQSDGEQRWVAGLGELSFDAAGTALSLIGTIQDITERKRVEAHQRLAARVLETTADAIMVTDTAANIVAVNPAFCRITGYAEDEVIGENPRLLKSGRHSTGHYHDMWKALLADGEWAGEVWNRRKNGEVFPMWQTLTSVRDATGKLANYVSVFTDLSEIRRAQDAAEQLSWRDPLTGLGNRALFIRQLEQKLASAQREERFASVVLLDLDRFKDINEARGLALGDALLASVAEQFTLALHKDDILARLDSDEFAVLLPRLNPKEDDAGRQALAVAEKLRRILRGSIELGGEFFHLDASIGIALFPRTAHESAADVLRQADTAMHQAKIDGGRTVFFEATMGESVRERYQLEGELRHAVREGQLLLYLQAQVASDGRPVGAEALVRWQHPTRGIVPPMMFIALAEATDIIVDIDRWMLNEVCQLLARLDGEGRALRIAVNISPRHFQQDDFVAEVKRTLAATGADPSHLVLEVTEGLVIGDFADVVAKMASLTELGIHFSMDDFGTGYSSLAYLKRLPIHELKIDKSFIQDAPTDPNDGALVETILAVAHHLNLQVVAEGVETQAQADFLNARAEVVHQGYLYGRPEAAEVALLKLLPRQAAAPPP